MMNPRTTFMYASVFAASMAAVLVALSGCSSEEEQPVASIQSTPPPPPPPAEPSVTPIEQLVAEMNIDARVSLPEDRAPDNDADRRAVLEFFDAMARGNAQALRSMLPLGEQLQLTAMVDDGSWNETVSMIKQIQVQTGSNSLAQKCALAVVEVGEGPSMTFQPQLWYYTGSGDEAQFEAAPAPPGILDKLSGDWIASWHAILDAEIAKSQEPDEDVTLAQSNLDSEEASSNTGSSPTPGGGGGTPTRSPGAPGGPNTPPL